MDFEELLNVCGEVNGYHLVEELIEKDFLGRSFGEKCEMGMRYAHILECRDCYVRFGESFEEYAMGNGSFDMERLHLSLAYLESFVRDF
jgi:hypothetical protein